MKILMNVCLLLGLSFGCFAQANDNAYFVENYFEIENFKVADFLQEQKEVAIELAKILSFGALGGASAHVLTRFLCYLLEIPLEKPVISLLKIILLYDVVFVFGLGIGSLCDYVEKMFQDKLYYVPSKLAIKETVKMLTAMNSSISTSYLLSTLTL